MRSAATVPLRLDGYGAHAVGGAERLPAPVCPAIMASGASGRLSSGAPAVTPNNRRRPTAEADRWNSCGPETSGVPPYGLAGGVTGRAGGVTGRGGTDGGVTGRGGTDGGVTGRGGTDGGVTGRAGTAGGATGGVGSVAAAAGLMERTSTAVAARPATGAAMPVRRRMTILSCDTACGFRVSSTQGRPTRLCNAVGTVRGNRRAARSRASNPARSSTFSRPAANTPVPEGHLRPDRSAYAPRQLVHHLHDRDRQRLGLRPVR